LKRRGGIRVGGHNTLPMTLDQEEGADLGFFHFNIKGDKVTKVLVPFLPG